MRIIEIFLEFVFDEGKKKKRLLVQNGNRCVFIIITIFINIIIIKYIIIYSYPVRAFENRTNLNVKLDRLFIRTREEIRNIILFRIIQNRHYEIHDIN